MAGVDSEGRYHCITIAEQAALAWWCAVSTAAAGTTAITSPSTSASTSASTRTSSTAAISHYRDTAPVDEVEAAPDVALLDNAVARKVPLHAHFGG